MGDVRIGTALSDPLGIVATPHSVIRTTGLDTDARAIAELIEKNEVTRVVVGMPLTERGERGHQADKVSAFIEALRAATTVEIVTMDERFTTAIAHRTLSDAGIRGNRKKGLVDKIAAQQILQSYLDRQASLRRQTTREF